MAGGSLTFGKEYEVSFRPEVLEYNEDGSGPYEIKSPVSNLSKNFLEPILFEKNIIETENISFDELFEYYCDDYEDYEQKGCHFHISVSNYNNSIDCNELYNRYLVYSFLIPIIRKLLCNPLYKRFRNTVFEWNRKICFISFTTFKLYLQDGDRFYYLVTTSKTKKTIEIRLSETSVIYDLICIIYCETFYQYLLKNNLFNKFKQMIYEKEFYFYELIKGKYNILPSVYYYKDFINILDELKVFTFEFNESKNRWEIEKLKLKNIWNKIKMYFKDTIIYNDQSKFLINLFEKYYLKGEKTFLEFIKFVYDKVDEYLNENKSK